MFQIKSPKFRLFVRTYLLWLFLPVGSFFLLSIFSVRLWDYSNPKPIADEYTTIENYGQYLDKRGPFLYSAQNIFLWFSFLAVILIVILTLKKDKQNHNGNEISLLAKIVILASSAVIAFFTLSFLSNIFLL